MFPFRSSRTGVERKARKKTGCSVQHPARKLDIVYAYGNVNRVRRIGAFTRGQSKKLPWVEAIAAELAILPSGQSGSPKEVRRLMIGGCCGGVTRPSGRFAGYRPGYTSLCATSRKPILVFGSNWGPLPGFCARKVGATTDPRHGCSVNTAESAGRLTRFTNAPRGRGGLNGWGCCAQSKEQAA